MQPLCSKAKQVPLDITTYHLERLLVVPSGVGVGGTCVARDVLVLVLVYDDIRVVR